MCISVLFYDGPSLGGSLLSSNVQQDSGSGDKTCGRSAAVTPCGINDQPNTAGGDGYDYERGRRMLLLHAWLMLPAWGLLLPAGALVPRFWSKALGKRWLYLHLGLVLAGLTLTFAGLYAAMDATSALLLTHFDPSAAKGHKVIGLLIITICASQLLGLIRPRKPAPSERPTRSRLLWSWSHRIGGSAAIVMAVANVVTGADAIALHVEMSKHGGPISLYCIMLLAAAAFGLLGFLLGKGVLARRKVSPQTSSVQQPAKVSGALKGRSNPTVITVKEFPMNHGEV